MNDDSWYWFNPNGYWISCTAQFAAEVSNFATVRLGKPMGDIYPIVEKN